MILVTSTLVALGEGVDGENHLRVEAVRVVNDLMLLDVGGLYEGARRVARVSSGMGRTMASSPLSMTRMELIPKRFPQFSGQGHLPVAGHLAYVDVAILQLLTQH